MIEIPTDTPADLVPLSWLLGVWEGTGVINYTAGDTHFEGQFRYRASFSHDGGPFLNYSATATLIGEDGRPDQLLTSESGFWRLARPVSDALPGPGLLPATATEDRRTVEDVEKLRVKKDGAFPVEIALSHSDGVQELYVGEVDGPRIQVGTDAVVRSANAKHYGSATRMYGLVGGRLFWVWDIAALGAELASHASAELDKVS